MHPSHTMTLIIPPAKSKGKRKAASPVDEIEEFEEAPKKSESRSTRGASKAKSNLVVSEVL